MIEALYKEWPRQEENLKIEPGIPIPEIVGRGAEGKNISLLRKMNIGDSVFFSGKHGRSLRNRYRVAAEVLNFKLSFRTLDDGVRMWRVK